VCADGTRFAPNAPPAKSATPCVAYDFGIREEAEFGVQFARAGCEVHAFDPSPTTAAYMQERFWVEYKDYSSELKKRYHIFHVFFGLLFVYWFADVPMIRVCVTSHCTCFTKIYFSDVNINASPTMCPCSD
jgi:hypothetical protein